MLRRRIRTRFLSKQGMPEQARRWNQLIKFLTYSALFVGAYCFYFLAVFIISSGRALHQIGSYFCIEGAGIFTPLELFVLPAFLSLASCMFLFFKKTICSSKAVKIALLTCLAIPVGCACIYYWQIGLFTSERWKGSPPTTSRHFYARQNMVDDLLRRYDLRGMPKEKIDLLLGKPASTQYFREFDYVYWLGSERGFFPIDSEWLCIKFQNAKVSEVKLCTD